LNAPVLLSRAEARLVSRPVRPDAVPAIARPSAGRAVGASVDPAERKAWRAEKYPALPDMPMAEEIAAALRHRPAAAVIADICRDLGIVPAHPLWGEVMTVLSGHGGNFLKFFKDAMARLFSRLTARSAAETDGWPVLGSQPSAACGTGPP
jgi:hypothetical protein